MAKKGKTPSLVSGGAGSIKFETALRKRTCRRCDGDILRGNKCAKVGIPGSFNSKTYCLSCFEDMIKQSRRDLDKLEQQV